MRKTIYLRTGQPIPDREPDGRYISGHGYVRLRWHVAPSTYVEAYEHRVIVGSPAPGYEVHHINGNPRDNSLDNLLIVTPEEHRAEHSFDPTQLFTMRGNRRWWNPAVFIELYQAGLSTQQIAERTGADPAVIWRGLKRNGIQTRSERRIAIPNREKP